MTELAAVRLNDWLQSFCQRLRAAGKPQKPALIAAVQKLLHAVSSVPRNRKPCIAITEQARAAQTPKNAANRACGPKNRLISQTVSHAGSTNVAA